MTDKPHILLRPFIFLWRTLNFIRTAIFNLIFFLILTIIIVGVNSDDFAVTDEINVPYVRMNIVLSDRAKLCPEYSSSDLLFLYIVGS